MRRPSEWVLAVAAGLVLAHTACGGTVFEATSPYHHIRVIDERGVRTLSFDGSMETRMSLADPLQGHFQYTEYFHMAWLWNDSLAQVLMIGLGGGSTQRAFQHYYPDVMIETVEIDPSVLHVAREYFHVKESPTLKVHLEDGRVYLRRSQKKYDAIFMDAYTEGRYGSFIPHHLVTKEFFTLASQHLTTNGVLAYNVIGSFQGPRAGILCSVYKTMKSVLPQVYLFPSGDSENVVLIGTKSAQRSTFNSLHQRASSLLTRKRITLPNFRTRLYSFRVEPPSCVNQATIFTDDFAPVDGVLGTVP